MNDTCEHLETFSREAAPHAQRAMRARQSLLTLAPPRIHADFRKLRQAVSRHHIVILRRSAVVAVTTLVSIGGAIFFHTLLVALFAWAWLHPWSLPVGDGKTFQGDPDRGGSPASFVVGEADPLSGNGAPLGTPDILASAPRPTAAPLADLPTLPDRLAPLDPVSIQTAVTTVLLPAELGDVKVQLPVPLAGASPPARTSSPPAAGGPRNGLAHGADVAFGGFEDERVFGLGRGNGNGTGRGAGNGTGNGIDRGLSAANRPAAILNSVDAGTNFNVPLQYRLKPPEKDVGLLIEVLADGTIGDITIAQSCGVPELDELVRDYARFNLRFSPAYKNKKAITSRFEYGQSFRPFDK